MSDMSKYDAEKIKKLVRAELIAMDGPTGADKITPDRMDYLMKELVRSYEMLEDKLKASLMNTVRVLEDNILDEFNDKKITKPMMEFYMKKLGDVRNCQLVLRDILK